MWELSTADEPVTIISALDRINSVSFSPDGRQVVSGGSDGIVKVWNANTGQQTLTLPGNVDAQIQCVAFSQDGMRLAAADQRGGVMLWDTRPWTPKQRAQAQSRSYLKILRDRVKSLEALTSYIRDDKTISEPVRQQCLDWSELFWKNRQSE